MITADDGPAADGLAADRALLGRTSTAQRVADILGTRIAEGFFKPGERLSELDIGTALGVSRNTLREAFRLLTHQRLLTHELNRGVSVRKPTVEDVRDIYRVRKLIECSAVQALTKRPAEYEALAKAVADGDLAAREGRWRDLGTANIHFHGAIASLAHSERVNELMTVLSAELRLVFQQMDDPRRFHERYLPRNRELLEVIGKGEGLVAASLLSLYLSSAENQLVEAYSKLEP
ncbi:GntR family transcriptional regulator [Amycolatopsis sp. cg5]|uniref:GntR family transcriptional regulator n=1 Tax=Amycolatopsis sp. cg5 TaxID=3238802 RepID=UPI003524E7AD